MLPNEGVLPLTPTIRTSRALISSQVSSANAKTWATTTKKPVSIINMSTDRLVFICAFRSIVRRVSYYFFDCCCTPEKRTAHTNPILFLELNRVLPLPTLTT